MINDSYKSRIKWTHSIVASNGLVDERLDHANWLVIRLSSAEVEVKSLLKQMHDDYHTRSRVFANVEKTNVSSVI